MRCFALRSTPSSPFLLPRVRQGPGFATRLGPGNPLTRGVGQGARPEGPPERDRDWSALSPQTLPRVKVADPDAPSSPPPGAGALPLFAHPGPPCPMQAGPGDRDGPQPCCTPASQGSGLGDPHGGRAAEDQAAVLVTGIIPACVLDCPASWRPQTTRLPFVWRRRSPPLTSQPCHRGPRQDPARPPLPSSSPLSAPWTLS